MGRKGCQSRHVHHPELCNSIATAVLFALHGLFVSMAAQPLTKVYMTNQHLSQLPLEKIPHDVKELICESLYTLSNTETLTSLHNSVLQPVDIIAS